LRTLIGAKIAFGLVLITHLREELRKQ